MAKLKKRIFNSIFITGLLFLSVFVYFIVFNKYHLLYLEQIQLFRFKWDYFADYLTKPEGIAEYSGAFLVQHFLFPIIGPLVVTSTLLVIYFAAVRILKRFNVSGILWSFIPVLMLVALHSDYLYKFGYSIGFMVSLTYIAACLSIQSRKIRLIFQFAGFLILYPFAGLFSFIAPGMFLLFELFFSKDKNKYFIVSGYILMMIGIPYLFWRYIYLLPLTEAWLRPLQSIGNVTSMHVMVMLMGYFPVLIIVTRFLSMQLKKTEFIFDWGWKNIVAGIIIIASISGLIKKYAWDSRTELILKIDNYIQKSDWASALEQCKLYPEPNMMVLYFTNLALLKSGHMGDQMFHYPQAGPEGLSLPWAANNLIPFFGCDIYYHLGYNNEAFRWAFEAMEVNGECPRLLKRLIMTSLINGDTKIAEKYLKQLQQSFFYQGWAGRYLEMADKPELLMLDKEISEKCKLIIQNDFFAGANNSELGLKKLLENHPDNKMAFEYYMAMLLLSKDMVSFVEATKRLKGLGYREIPVEYEEAILWYIGYSKQNVIPEGYGIRNSTLQRFKDYSYSYSKYSGSPNQMAKSLKEKFGTTFWFYYHFINPQKTLQ